jgi:hypothetical protein
MQTRTLSCLVVVVSLTWMPLASSQTVVALDGASHAAVLDALHLDAAEVQELPLPVAPDGPLIVPISLGGERLVLELLPHSLRADDFQLLVQEPDGRIAARAAPAATTLRGAVAGRPGSVVAGALVDGRLSVLIRMDGHLFGVQPVPGHIAPSLHAAYFAGAIRPFGGVCQEVPAPAPPRAPSAPAPDYAGAPSSDKVAQVGLDSDVEFFAFHGTVEAAQADMETVYEAVDAIFIDDVGVYNVVTGLIIRTSEPDPYGANSAGGALGEVTNEWIANQGAIERDLVQLFTGKGWDGLTVGLAYVGANTCNPGAHYSAVRTNSSGNFLLRVALSAHEAGHTWGANHCNGQPDCAIMCSNLGGCNGITFYGSSAVAAITNTKTNGPCLDSICGGFAYGEIEGNSATLTSTGPGSPGSDLSFTYANPPSATSTAFTAIAADPGNLPFGPGVLLIDVDTLFGFTPGVTFTSLGDTPSELFSIPNIATLVGRRFFLQGAFFDGGPVSALSNGVSVVVCD